MFGNFSLFKATCLPNLVAFVELKTWWKISSRGGSVSEYAQAPLASGGRLCWFLRRYDGDFRLPLVFALESPNFPSSCEGKLGVVLESMQIGRASCRERV